MIIHSFSFILVFSCLRKYLLFLGECFAIPGFMRLFSHHRPRPLCAVYTYFFSYISMYYHPPRSSAHPPLTTAAPSFSISLPIRDPSHPPSGSLPAMSKIRRRWKNPPDGLIHYSCGHSRAATEADGQVRRKGYVQAMCRTCFQEWYETRWGLRNWTIRVKEKVGGGGWWLLRT